MAIPVVFSKGSGSNELRGRDLAFSQALVRFKKNSCMKVYVEVVITFGDNGHWE